MASLQREHAARLSQHRAREECLEEMLRQLAQALRAEISRADEAISRAEGAEAQLREAREALSGLGVGEGHAVVLGEGRGAGGGVGEGRGSPSPDQSRLAEIAQAPSWPAGGGAPPHAAPGPPGGIGQSSFAQPHAQPLTRSCPSDPFSRQPQHV
eukprot:scaffold17684_cov56-Isochrysis_galbana.AAC.1